MDPKSVSYLKLADERTVRKSKWINIFYFRQSIVYKMKVSQKIYTWTSALLLVCCSLIFPSCEKKEIRKAVENRKTLFIYLPWSTDLTGYFYTNITDMEACVSKKGLEHEKNLVFMSTSTTEATMFEIIYSKGKCERKTLKKYGNPRFTTVEGITGILNDVQEFAPAPVYTMIISSHGMGWLPADGTQARSLFQMKKHWEYQEQPMTRYFGGLTREFQTDVSTLARGIIGAGIKMEYILFDDCYMSSVEVAYELKEATRFLIASTSEMMAYGMPYATVGEFLLGSPDYGSLCEGFYDFYSTYEIMPCGTLAVTDCSELDNMATIMKSINERYVFDDSLQGELQELDGYTPVIFYDFADYVLTFCSDPVLKNGSENSWTGLFPIKPIRVNFIPEPKESFPYALSRV